MHPSVRSSILTILQHHVNNNLAQALCSTMEPYLDMILNARISPARKVQEIRSLLEFEFRSYPFDPEPLILDLELLLQPSIYEFPIPEEAGVRHSLISVNVDTHPIINVLSGNSNEESFNNFSRIVNMNPATDNSQIPNTNDNSQVVDDNPDLLDKVSDLATEENLNRCFGAVGALTSVLERAVSALQRYNSGSKKDKKSKKTDKKKKVQEVNDNKPAVATVPADKPAA